MSEATNRVLEAQLRRQKQHDKRQKEWETALKPTTIDGSGVLRQLGQQPLDNRQILPNTASPNRPIRPTAVPGGVVADWLPRVKVDEPDAASTSLSRKFLCLLEVTLPSEQDASIDRKMLVVFTGSALVKLVEYEEWDWGEYRSQNDFTSTGTETRISSTLAWQLPDNSWTDYPGERRTTTSVSNTTFGLTYPSISSHQLFLRVVAPTPTRRYGSIGTFSLVKGFYRTVYAVNNSGSVLENSTLRFYGFNPDSFRVLHGWGINVSSSTYSITSLMSNMEALMAEKQVELIYMHTARFSWFVWVRVREVDTRERFNASNGAGTLPDLPDGVFELSEWWYGLNSSGRSLTYKRTKLFSGSYSYQSIINGIANPPQTSPIPIVDFEQTPRSYLLTWDPVAYIVHPDSCSEDWALNVSSNYKQNNLLFSVNNSLSEVEAGLLDSGITVQSRTVTTTPDGPTCSAIYGSDKNIRVGALSLTDLANLPDTPVDPSYFDQSKINVIALASYF